MIKLSTTQSIDCQLKKYHVCYRYSFVKCKCVIKTMFILNLTYFYKIKTILSIMNVLIFFKLLK